MEVLTLSMIRDMLLHGAKANDNNLRRQERKTWSRWGLSIQSFLSRPNLVSCAQARVDHSKGAEKIARTSGTETTSTHAQKQSAQRSFDGGGLGAPRRGDAGGELWKGTP
jgi:hypothetical protein